MTETVFLPEARHDTLGEIADELLVLYNERRKLDGRITHLYGVLLDASAEYSNGMDDPWWQGATIRGKQVAWYAAMRLTEGGDNPKWEKHLFRVKEDRRDHNNGNA